MSKTIYDYDAAVTIDGSTHWLLIQPGTNSVDYNRISRDVFLGVSGQPADVSTAQNVTNKTLDNTNTITLKDSLFTLQDNLDTTKQAQFQLSGITTATTRTYTLPDASTTLVGTGTTQTLTAKTLTSPVITGGSISNSTIAVDAIAEYTVNNGVTIDGLNIMNGALNTNNSVVTSNITDSAVTPAKLQSGTGSGWSWQSWTPTWTNFTVSSSTVTAYYTQIGKTVFFRVNVTLAGGNNPSGSVSMSLPVTSVSYAGASNATFIGNCAYVDTGTNEAYGPLLWTNTTTALLRVWNASTTYLLQSNLSSTVPQTWADSDQVIVVGTYEAA